MSSSFPIGFLSYCHQGRLAERVYMVYNGIWRYNIKLTLMSVLVSIYLGALPLLLGDGLRHEMVSQAEVGKPCGVSGCCC